MAQRVVAARTHIRDDVRDVGHAPSLEASRSSRRSSSKRDASNPSMRRIAPAAAAAAPAGIRPTSSAPATSTPRAAASRSIAATISCSADASQSSTFMLTCAWPALGRSSPSARTPGKPPSRSRTDRGDLARRVDVRADEIHVERDQRPPRADDRAACRRIELRRPEVRRELARIDPPLQLAGPAAAEERRPAARPDLAVEEHRQPELLADPPRELERGGTRTLHVLGPDRHDRDDVGGADPRMHALVVAKIDPLRARRRSPRRARRRAPARSPTSVNTVRLWSASVWTSRSSACSASARPIALITAAVAALARSSARIRAAAPLSVL